MDEYVLVTTTHRGVFCGRRGEGDLPDHITLHDARNCIYWHQSMGGFLGLAAVGPNDSCRIGAAVSEITLYDITSVTPVTAEAIAEWRKATTWVG